MQLFNGLLLYSFYMVPEQIIIETKSVGQNNISIYQRSFSVISYLHIQTILLFSCLLEVNLFCQMQYIKKERLHAVCRGCD